MQVSDTTPSGNPDLIVYSTSVFDKTYEPGESFSMSFWVRNQGDGASSGTASLTYYRSSDSTISSSEPRLTIQNGTTGVGSIAADGLTLVTIALTSQSSGVFYFGACVGTVTGESNTQNNCAAVFKVTLTAPLTSGCHRCRLATGMAGAWCSSGWMPPLSTKGAENRQLPLCVTIGRRITPYRTTTRRLPRTELAGSTRTKLGPSPIAFLPTG